MSEKQWIEVKKLKVKMEKVIEELVSDEAAAFGELVMAIIDSLADEREPVSLSLTKKNIEEIIYEAYCEAEKKGYVPQLFQKELLKKLSLTVDSIEARKELMAHDIEQLKIENDALNKQHVEDAQKIVNYKGALRTLANELEQEESVPPSYDAEYETLAWIDCWIAYALAHPEYESLDEISSKDYGADGVGLTHAEIDSLAYPEGE